jgi:hypothetical protein
MDDHEWQRLAAEGRQRMVTAQRLLAQPSVSEKDQIELLKGIRAVAEAASNAGIGSESETSFRAKIDELDRLIANLSSRA